MEPPAGPGPTGFEYDAFISYASRDRPAVERLQHFLQTYRVPGRAPLRLFLDKTDLAPRGLWDALGAEIARSRRLVLVVSPQSAGNPNVLKELALFEARPGGGEVVVVLLEGPPSLVPRSLQAHKYADLRDGLHLHLRLHVLRRRLREEMLRVLSAVGDVPLRTLAQWDRQRRRDSYLQVGSVLLVTALALALLFRQERERREAAYADRLFAEARSQAFFAEQVPLTVAYLQGSDRLARRPDVQRLLARLSGYLEFGSVGAAPGDAVLLALDAELRLGRIGATGAQALPVHGPFTSAVRSPDGALLALAHEDGRVSLLSLDPPQELRSLRLFSPDTDEKMRFAGLEGLEVACLDANGRALLRFADRHGSAAGLVTALQRTVDLRSGKAGPSVPAESGGPCAGRALEILDVGQVSPATPFDEDATPAPDEADALAEWRRAEFSPLHDERDEAPARRERWARFLKDAGLPEGFPGLDGYGLAQAVRVRELSPLCEGPARWLHITENLGRGYGHHLVRLQPDGARWRWDGGVFSTEAPGDYRFFFAPLPGCRAMVLPEMTLLDLTGPRPLHRGRRPGWVADHATQGDTLLLRTGNGQVWTVPLPAAGAASTPDSARQLALVEGADVLAGEDGDAPRGLFAPGNGDLLATTTGSRLALVDAEGRLRWTSPPHERFGRLVGAVRDGPDTLVLAAADAWLQLDLATGFPLGGWQLAARQEPGGRIASIEAVEGGGFRLFYQHRGTTTFTPRAAASTGGPVAVPWWVQDGEIRRGWPTGARRGP